MNRGSELHEEDQTQKIYLIESGNSDQFEQLNEKQNSSGDQGDGNQKTQTKEQGADALRDQKEDCITPSRLYSKSKSSQEQGVPSDDASRESPKAKLERCINSSEHSSEIKERRPRTDRVTDKEYDLRSTTRPMNIAIVDKINEKVEKSLSFDRFVLEDYYEERLKDLEDTHQAQIKETRQQLIKELEDKHKAQIKEIKRQGEAETVALLEYIEKIQHELKKEKVSKKLCEEEKNEVERRKNELEQSIQRIQGRAEAEREEWEKSIQREAYSGQEKIRNLQTQLQECQESLEIGESKLTQYQKRQKSAIEQNHSLRESLDQKNSQIDRLLERISLHHETHESLQGSLEQAKIENSKKEEQANSLQQQFNSISEQNVRLKSQISALKAEVKEKEGLIGSNVDEKQSEDQRAVLRVPSPSKSNSSKRQFVQNSGKHQSQIFGETVSSSPTDYQDQGLCPEEIAQKASENRQDSQARKTNLREKSEQKQHQCSIEGCWQELMRLDHYQKRKVVRGWLEKSQIDNVEKNKFINWTETYFRVGLRYQFNPELMPRSKDDKPLRIKN